MQSTKLILNAQRGSEHALRLFSRDRHNCAIEDIILEVAGFREHDCVLSIVPPLSRDHYRESALVHARNNFKVSSGVPDCLLISANANMRVVLRIWRIVVDTHCENCDGAKIVVLLYFLYKLVSIDEFFTLLFVYEFSNKLLSI